MAVEWVNLLDILSKSMLFDVEHVFIDVELSCAIIKILYCFSVNCDH